MSTSKFPLRGPGPEKRVELVYEIGDNVPDDIKSNLDILEVQCKKRE